MGKYETGRLERTIGVAIRFQHWKLVNALATELALRFPKNVRASVLADKYLAKLTA